ncbi:MAG: hypothetical protein OEY87_00780 [Gammaproteobacteria bacterium]|nr:hypothetical protein [Gammaproteobacteria bacterium]MDH5734629.1 hypothetical protein [Gammaproteobacteria bacterium]
MLQLKQLMHKSLLMVIGSALLALSTAVYADGDKASFMPDIPEPKDESLKCVQPEDEMKKNHMEYILHQRDKTLREGVRTKQYSLKECINCHVEKNSTARFGDDKHFCSSCHNYAGVTIDCFQCHADRPSSNNKHSQSTSSFPHYADNSVEGASK